MIERITVLPIQSYRSFTLKLLSNVPSEIYVLPISRSDDYSHNKCRSLFIVKCINGSQIHVKLLLTLHMMHRLLKYLPYYQKYRNQLIDYFSF